MRIEFESLTIIICANDEVDSLRKTVNIIVDTCKASDIAKIVIVYPAFITEECLATVNSLAHQYEKVPVVSYRQRKPGLGCALQEGITLSESSHTLIIDADCSRNPEIIAQLIELSRANPEKICKTSRLLKKNSFHNYGKINYIANRMAQIFLKVLFGNKCTDMTDALQLVPTSIYQSINWTQTGFSFFIEMVLKPMRLGCEYLEIPVDCYGRTQGTSRNTLKEKIKYFTCALKIRFTPRKELLLK